MRRKEHNKAIHCRLSSFRFVLCDVGMNNNLHSFLRFCSPTLNWIQLECQSPYSAYAWKDFKLLNSDMGHDCRASKLTRERPHLCALDFELKFHYRIYFIWNQHTSSSSSNPTVITRYQMMMLYFLSIVWPCVAGIASSLIFNGLLIAHVWRRMAA